LAGALDERGIAYKRIEGEAVFYGPEDRYSRGGRNRPHLAVNDRGNFGFQFSGDALKLEYIGERPKAAIDRHNSSGTVWFDGAVLWPAIEHLRRFANVFAVQSVLPIAQIAYDFTRRTRPSNSATRVVCALNRQTSHAETWRQTIANAQCSIKHAKGTAPSNQTVPDES